MLVAGCWMSLSLGSQRQLQPRAEVMELGRGKGRDGEGEGCQAGQKQTGWREEMLWALLSAHGVAGRAQLQGDTAASPEPARFARTCWGPCDAVGATWQGHCH